MSKTLISIDGEDFRINKELTYAGRSFRGWRVEGLLMNARLIQGIFDDLNPETRGMWDYPDGPWDPERNTNEFIAMMPKWRSAGLLSFTIGLQGGSPLGYSKNQPWHNSAFKEDGTLREDYLKRLKKILDHADELGMAPIVSFFYFGQDHRLKDESAVLRATDEATDWILQQGYTHVLIELVNETDVPKYVHDILKPQRVSELIVRVQERTAGRVATDAGRLLAGTSYQGGVIPDASVIEVSDLVLIHGNSVTEPARIHEMVREVRDQKSYRGQPIVFNEDDHFDFDLPENNMLAAVAEHASWGYFDYRFKKNNEGFEEGYQSVPTDWGSNSERKRGFFRLLREVTGEEA